MILKNMFYLHWIETPSFKRRKNNFKICCYILNYRYYFSINKHTGTVLKKSLFTVRTYRYLFSVLYPDPYHFTYTDRYLLYGSWSSPTGTLYSLYGSWSREVIQIRNTAVNYKDHGLHRISNAPLLYKETKYPVPWGLTGQCSQLCPDHHTRTWSRGTVLTWLGPEQDLYCSKSKPAPIRIISNVSASFFLIIFNFGKSGDNKKYTSGFRSKCPLKLYRSPRVQVSMIPVKKGTILYERP